MTRRHRYWHAWLWLVFGPLIIAGFVIGVRARPTPLDEQPRRSGPPESRPGDALQPREVVP
jgi:hypothetical protein